MKKKFLIVIFIACLLYVFLINTYANAATSLDSIIQGADDFVSTGGTEAASSGTSYNEIKNVSSMVFNTFLTIGTIAAAIVIGILGIKFMMAPSEEKAQIKESMIPYVIGCFVMFGSFTIWKIVVQLGNLM